MAKTTLTFYLPRHIFRQAKIAAVKEGISFSDLAVRSALALIASGAPDLQRSNLPNDEKVMVYLLPEEKKGIRLAAAEWGTSVSALFCRGLEGYLSGAKELPGRKKAPALTGHPSRPPPAQRKKPFSIHLTAENHFLLRRLSAERDRSITSLLLEALEKTAPETLRRAPPTGPKAARTSIYLEQKELDLVKSKAREANLGLFELLNRALEVYWHS